MRRRLGTVAGLTVAAWSLAAPAVWAQPGGAGTAVIQGFLSNVASWFQYLAGVVALCTVAYGGLRHAAAHSAHAQAEAWRIVAAGIGGLVIALLAPSIVSIVQGLIPS